MCIGTKIPNFRYLKYLIFESLAVNVCRRVEVSTNKAGKTGEKFLTDGRHDTQLNESMS